MVSASRLLLIAIIGSLALAACGGGSSSAAAATPTPTQAAGVKTPQAVSVVTAN